MVALAIGDWPENRALVAAGAVAVDYLETHGVLADAAREQLPAQPLLLHNAIRHWSIGDPAALEHDGVLPRTLHALRVTGAPWLSVHLGFSAAAVHFDVWMRALSPTLLRAELFAIICRNVRALAAAIPAPLLLENLDYCPGGAYEHVCEPDFISAVLTETGAGLLLDLAHARVSAARLGIPIADYLGRLPLDRVVQLHVSGPRPRDGVLADAHEPMLAEDYALLAWVLARTQPQALTLEYYKDETALREQLARLQEIIGKGEQEGPS